MVQDARSKKPVIDATIEILTLDNAIITTLTRRDQGYVLHSLRAGSYRLRVTHPDFTVQTRHVEIGAGGATEVRFSIAHRSGPVPRASF